MLEECISKERAEDLRKQHSELLKDIRDKGMEVLKSIKEGERDEDDWIIVAEELRKKLIEFYSRVINEIPELKTKGDKIDFLKKLFSPADQRSPWGIDIEYAMCKAIGCSWGYFRRRNGEVTSKRRKKVFKRDKNKCVRCGSKKNLAVHHIIPVRSSKEGGTEEIDNLVTLCKKCHLEMHGGDYGGDVPYRDTDDFWVRIIQDSMECVGKRIAKRLYQHFGDIESIKKASTNDLKGIKGVSEKRARLIHRQREKL